MSHFRKNDDRGDILFVTDRQSGVRPLYDMLADQDFNVHFASAEASVITAISENPPDLILLDVKSVENDDRNFYQQLKVNQDLKCIPVIFIIEGDAGMEKTTCFAVGGADYISIPFEPTETLARIETQVRLHKMKTQLKLTTQQLNHARKNADQLHADLDHQVQQRTAELESANQALRDIKAQFEAVYNHHYQLTGLLDKEGRLLMGNRTALELAGVEADEVVGKYFWDTPWWSHSQKTQHQLKDAIRKAMNGELVQFDTTHISATGEKREIDFRMRPVFDDNGELIYLVPEGYDITERKQAEAALRKSRERLHRIVTNAVVGIYQVTHEGEFLLVNQKFAQMFGYTSPNEFMDSVDNINHLYVDPSERPTLLKEIDNKGFVDDAEIQFWNKNGQIILVRASVRVIRDDKKGLIYEGVMADITEQKRAEQALQESEEKLARSKKMESLGLLASGVAHDLNNVLSGVIAYPELLLMELPPDSKFRKPIEVIQDSGHRAVAIVQDLLTVARGVAITKEPLNLNEIVSDYLYSPEFKKLEQFHPSVKVTINLDQDLLNVSGSSVHIRKVVMNLVSNGMEAAAGGGQVIISTRNRYMDRPLRGYDDITVGEYVVLTVTDDGTGIAPDDLERIFEPFYTKKVMGRSGTGLGLAVVWNTVQDHQGYIDVRSSEKGTTFELYFPMTRAEFVKEDLSVSIEDYMGNNEMVLVVDDEASQREITCRMLQTLGYQTEVASSGEAAVEYLKTNAVDLLLLDMIMDPGMNGRETYDQISRYHPNQKAIIISGFAETEEVKKTQQLGAGRFVKKPFTLTKIGLAIKQELAL